MSQPPLASPALCRAPTQRYVAGCPSAVSWPAWLYRRRKAARLAGCVLGWLCCIATQPNLSSLSKSQYNFFVLRHKPSHPSSLPQSQLYCNTIANPPSLLQYNLSSSLHFQQAFLLQYTFKSCNTISPSQYELGSSPSKSAPFFFHYNYYSYLFIYFSYLQKLEKSLKKIIFHFFIPFFLDTQ